MSIQKLKIFYRNILNKKIFVFFLLLCFLLGGFLKYQIATSTKADLTNENQQLYPIKKGIFPKWGYINKHGKVIIKPQFDEAYEFQEGLAAVRVGDLFGYINKHGEFIIKPAYYGASSFSDGLTAVATTYNRTHHGKFPCEWVYINKDGEVISDKYDDAYSFSEGMAMVYQEEKGYGYIDKSGILVIEPQFEMVGAFNEQLARVLIKQGEDEKFGYINKYGDFVIKPQFDTAKDFSQGVAAVCIDYEKGWGFIDKTGKFITKLESKYEINEGFSEGIVPVKIYENLSEDSGAARLNDERTGKYKFGALDQTGKVLFKTDNIYIDNFSNGLAAVAIRKPSKKSSGQVYIHGNPDYIWGYIDNQGKLAIKPKYFWAGPFDKEGIAKVEVTKLFFWTDIGYIDKTGSFIWKPN